MQPVSRPDPAPSRWAYRFERLMLTPLFRRLVKVGVPFCLSFGLGTAYLADEARQQKLVLAMAGLRQQIEARPEFQIRLMAVEGASAAVETEIRDRFAVPLPASSFDLDLDAIRAAIVALPAVADASVRLRRGGVLETVVEERRPVALWKTRAALWVVDRAGVRIRRVAPGDARPALPLLAGAGAAREVPEALAILRAALPFEARIRGLRRVGERRWDLMLDRDQVIMLPEAGPVRALERVIVLNEVQDMLERDVAAVDMRLAGRPTIRMNAHAVEEWWRVTTMTIGTE